MNYGWTIVSRSNEVCGGPVVATQITCKKHYLQACATGGVICVSQEEAEAVQREINGPGVYPELSSDFHISNPPLKPGFKPRVFTRSSFFKCRLNKHWLYKPTRSEKTHFDQMAIQRIMDV